MRTLSKPPQWPLEHIKLEVLAPTGFGRRGLQRRLRFTSTTIAILKDILAVADWQPAPRRYLKTRLCPPHSFFARCHLSLSGTAIHHYFDTARGELRHCCSLCPTAHPSSAAGPAPWPELLLPKSEGSSAGSASSRSATSLCPTDGACGACGDQSPARLHPISRFHDAGAPPACLPGQRSIAALANFSRFCESHKHPAFCATTRASPGKIIPGAKVRQAAAIPRLPSARPLSRRSLWPG